jgi:hypothetical protein
MERTRLQSRHLKPAQPSADGSFGHRDREPPCHLFTQIDTAPADYFIFRWIGALDGQRLQLRHLFLVQRRRMAAGPDGLQARNPFGIVAMNPVPQGLTLAYPVNPYTYYT